MGGICGAGSGDSFGGGNEDPYEAPGTFGSVNLTAPDKNEPKEDKQFFPSMIGVLDSVLGSLGSTPPEQEEQEKFTISSGAAPFQPAKPMQDLIFGTTVPSTEEPRPAGTGVTIQGGNI